jgi:hypothetical protein
LNLWKRIGLILLKEAHVHLSRRESCKNPVRTLFRDENKGYGCGKEIIEGVALIRPGPFLSSWQTLKCYAGGEV